MRFPIVLGGAAASVAVLGLARPAAAIEPGWPQRTRSFGGQARLGVLTGEPRAAHPDAGYGLGMAIGWYWRPNLALRLEGDYDRWGDPRADGDQLARSTFTAQQVLAHPVGERWLPWVGAGAGVLVGVFRDASADRFVEDRAVLPVGRATAAIDYEVAPRMTVGLRAEWQALVWSRRAELGGRSRRLYDDTLHLSAGADLYF